MLHSSVLTWTGAHCWQGCSQALYAAHSMQGAQCACTLSALWMACASTCLPSCALCCVVLPCRANALLMAERELLCEQLQGELPLQSLFAGDPPVLTCMRAGHSGP